MSHFGRETNHCGPTALKFDYFRVLSVRSAAVGTFSFPAKCLLGHESGQIITTSAEVTLNGGLIRELP